jgi:hypothetical protein
MVDKAIQRETKTKGRRRVAKTSRTIRYMIFSSWNNIICKGGSRGN